MEGAYKCIGLRWWFMRADGCAGEPTKHASRVTLVGGFWIEPARISFGQDLLIVFLVFPSLSSPMPKSMKQKQAKVADFSVRPAILGPSVLSSSTLVLPLTASLLCARRGGSLLGSHRKPSSSSAKANNKPRMLLIHPTRSDRSSTVLARGGRDSTSWRYKLASGVCISVHSPASYIHHLTSSDIVPCHTGPMYVDFIRHTHILFNNNADIYNLNHCNSYRAPDAVHCGR